jgi:glycerol-3-phosphate dehydrogenase
LIAGKRGETADLSRRHAVYDIAPGVIGITGGKLTTYRRMAADAVDRAAEGLGHQAKSRTRWIRLGSSDVGRLHETMMRRSIRLGIPEATVWNLIRTFGDRALEVLDVAEGGAVDPVVPGHAPIAAEILYSVRTEQAVQLSDALSRRTRLSLIDPAAGIGSGSSASEIMGTEAGWSTEERFRQERAHRIAIEQERGLPLREVEPKPTTIGSRAG